MRAAFACDQPALSNASTRVTRSTQSVGCSTCCSSPTLELIFSGNVMFLMPVIWLPKDDERSAQPETSAEINIFGEPVITAHARAITGRAGRCSLGHVETSVDGQPRFTGIYAQPRRAILKWDWEPLKREYHSGWPMKNNNFIPTCRRETHSPLDLLLAGRSSQRVHWQC